MRRKGLVFTAVVFGLCVKTSLPKHELKLNTYLIFTDKAQFAIKCSYNTVLYTHPADVMGI